MVKISKLVMTSLLSGAIALGISACAPTPTHEGTGGYIDDTVITTKVKAALLAEPALKSTEIKVITFKGRVQLSGFVSNRYMSQRAIQVARQIKGVNKVIDDMQIK